MKKIKYFWFVYKGDEQQIVESVKCLRRADPDAAVIVADDCFAPISSAVAKVLVDDYRCRYLQTAYNRNGNLLGPDNLIGQTQLFVDHSDGCDVIVKLDADTLLIDTSWIYDFADNQPHAVMAGIVRQDNLHYLYGQAYAIRVDQLQKLAEDARRVKSHIAAFEDYEISTRLFRLNDYRLDYAVRHVLGIPSGFILTTLAQANESFANSRCCNFGYDLQQVPPEQRPVYKDRQLALMKRINEILDERKAKAKSEDK